MKENPQHLPTEATTYVWTEAQRSDLMALRQAWLDVAKRFERRFAKRKGSVFNRVVMIGAKSAFEGCAETLMELIDDHLV